MYAHDSRISNRQIAMLHALKREKQIDEKAYREILNEAASVSTSTALSQLGFDAVLDLIEALFSAIPGRRPMSEFTVRTGRASPSQLRYIESLWRRIFDDDQAFRHWLERFFKASDLRFLTPAKASCVIEALKEMSARGWPRHE